MKRSESAIEQVAFPFDKRLAYANLKMSLSEMKADREAVVSRIDGDSRFLSRITSIGITPGCRVKVLRNDKNRPVLVYSRDTMIALNRKECNGIEVTEVGA